MTRHDSTVRAGMVIALVVSAMAATANAQIFDYIRLGDVDGFGYGAAPGLVGANGQPANRDGVGVLNDGDLLPDLNMNGFTQTGQGDDFDNRSMIEKTGLYVEGNGFSDFANTTGSQFTDISLSTSFDTTFPPPNDFPSPPSFTLPNQPGFIFDFFVLANAVDPMTPVFINVVFGDYDVQPAMLVLRRADLTEFSVALIVQPPGEDGLVQAAFAQLTFADVFAPKGLGYRGYLEVDFDAPGEPYTAFDFAELSVRPIPEPATLALLAIGGLTTLRRRRIRY
ncbi:MAG: PEP-CTERM sorting domain-containing protein [Phycisphaerae bacterium]|nr:PEP-CTERM sorting domain-containing protein [Phycisphaerae bacterium]